MTDIESILSATLQDWRRSSFAWGIRDCMLSAADYAAKLTGFDAGADYRGRYADEGGAKALVEAAGGGVAILGGALIRAGLKRVQQARRGDVICAQIGRDEIGGVCLGAFCAFRTPTRGTLQIKTTRITILGAWRA